MNSIRRAFALLVVVTAPCAVADTLPPLLDNALLNMSPMPAEQWAFTRLGTSDGRDTVERYDPRCEPAWTLVSIDGDAPTKKEQRKLQKRAAQRSHPGSPDLAELAEPGSVVLESEDDTTAVYSFKPQTGDDDEGINEHLAGTMTVRKAGPWVESMEMRSTGSFKASVARIDRMWLRMELAEVTTGHYAITRSRQELDGKALFKTLEQRNEARFEQFERVDGACPGSAG